MKKLITYGILILVLLSSCSKKDSSIEPENVNKNEQSALSIVIDDEVYHKSADAYTTEVETKTQNTTYSSSFRVNTPLTNGSVQVQLETPSNSALETGVYPMNNADGKANISFTSNGNTWSSTNGHQKGSIFHVLSSEKLEAATGFVTQLKVQVSCYLYSAKGESIPFKCTTTIKF